jgi:hypothetical protein
VRTDNQLLPISFNIPLAAGIESDRVHIVTGFPTPPAAPPDCENPDTPGAAGIDNPEADPGFLCVYGIRNNLRLTTFNPATFAPGVNKAGTILTGAKEDVGGVTPSGFGTWAVTGFTPAP